MPPAQPSSTAEQLLVPPLTLEPKTSNKSSKEAKKKRKENWAFAGKAARKHVRGKKHQIKEDMEKAPTYIALSIDWWGESPSIT